MIWRYGTSPVMPAWYPVLICYDSHEGAFPSAAFWNMEEWDRHFIVAFGDPCATEKFAKETAYLHDPDNQV